jgi:hypothetical protein
MFRLFLKKKIFAGDKAKATKGAKAERTTRGTAARAEASEAYRRNRRVFARYSIDHKHLMMMNEADILLIREISAKGFSTEVSPRGLTRLVHGDIYEARIRYLGEIYDLEARVAWKAAPFVGFEIVKASRETLMFIKRLLRPIEIALSLTAVEASFMHEQATGKSWFHGEDESDLYVWHDSETQALTAWQLAVGETFIEWDATNGLATGSLVAVRGREALMGVSLPGLTHNRDAGIDARKRQFAVDVIMALPHPVREEILETFLG